MLRCLIVLLVVLVALSCVSKTAAASSTPSIKPVSLSFSDAVMLTHGDLTPLCVADSGPDGVVEYEGDCESVAKYVVAKLQREYPSWIFYVTLNGKQLNLI